MTRYTLTPNDGRKSFYGKAFVEIDDNGNRTLVSYNTKVLRENANGTFIRLWNDWSATTGRHIKAFCNMNKKEFFTVPYNEAEAETTCFRAHYINPFSGYEMSRICQTEEEANEFENGRNIVRID